MIVSSKGDVYFTALADKTPFSTPCDIKKTEICYTVDCFTPVIAKFTSQLDYVWHQKIISTSKYRYELSALAVDEKDNVYFAGEGSYFGGWGVCCSKIVFGKLSQPTLPAICRAPLPQLDVVKSSMDVCPNGGRMVLKLKGVEDAL